MPQISTRGTNRAELTHKQVDDNFINLNTAVITAQNTANQALAKANAYPSLAESTGRIRISPNSEADDSVHTLQVNGSARINDRTSMGGTPGAESLRVNLSLSGGNPGGRLDVTGGTAAALYPRVQSVNPSVPDASLHYGTQASGAHRFWTNTVGGSEQVRINHTANVTSYLTLTGGVSGGGPYISAGGASAAIPLVIASKGNAVLTFQANSTTQMQVASVSNAVNYAQVSGAATGGYVRWSAKGADTNVGMLYETQGSSTHDFYAATRKQFVIGGPSNAVNYFSVLGAATAGQPILRVEGSDTNVPFRIDSKGTGSIYLNNGGFLALDVTGGVSGGNNLRVSGAASGSPPRIDFTGPDTNVAAYYNTKGNGHHDFATGGSTQLRIQPFVGAGNFLNIRGGSTGIGPVLEAAGVDTNVFLAMASKGNESIRFYTNSFLAGTGNEQFRIAHTPNAVNYIQVTGNVAGSSPQVTSAGTDTNIALRLSSKGTSNVNFYTNNQTNLQFAVGHVPNSANYVAVYGGAVGGRVLVRSEGTDANIPLGLCGKDSSVQLFTDSNQTVRGFNVAHTPNGVNYFQTSSSVAGTPVALAAQGSDTDIGIALIPKGAGNIHFGTFTANADAPITGYITIKDAGGTTRKLAVIA